MILNGSFSPSRSPNSSQLFCDLPYKPSREGNLTCAWFFGPQGIVDISPLYPDLNISTHHHVNILRSYSTLACVPLPRNSSSISEQEASDSGMREMRQGQVIPPLSTISPSTSWQGGVNRRPDGEESAFIDGRGGKSPR